MMPFLCSVSHFNKLLKLRVVWGPLNLQLVSEMRLVLGTLKLSKYL